MYWTGAFEQLRQSTETGGFRSITIENDTRMNQTAVSTMAAITTPRNPEPGVTIVIVLIAVSARNESSSADSDNATHANDRICTESTSAPTNATPLADVSQSWRRGLE